ncbi:MSTO1 protein, partial [Polypterus senegalus]|nr:MSTO1 protein [Polypterus senegalus]
MSNPCREVITLQLGHYANFVGSHWWNLQDASLCYDASPEETPSEIFSDVLFRVGQTHSGQTTYTPRLIAFDLKDMEKPEMIFKNYNSTCESNSYAYNSKKYELEDQDAEDNFRRKLKFYFMNPCDKFKARGRKPWKLGLQILKIIIITAQVRGGKYMFPNSSLSVPNTVNGQLEHGRKAYNLESSVRVWSDFLRVHLHPKTISIVNQYSYEGECDRLEAFGQGESLLKENSFLDDLEDKLHFFVEECDYLQSIVKDVYHLINSVLSFVHLSNNSSSFCPLSLRGGLERRPSPHTTFPYLLYDASSWYHSSAVLATVLDTLTLPYRLHNGGCSMGHLIDALVFSGRKVLCASASVPFPMVSDKSLPDTLVDFGETLPWRPVSACGELRENRCFAQSVCLRGISPHNMICAVNLIQSPCKLTAPFPQIFSPSVNKDGFLQIKPRPFGSIKSLDLRRFNSFLSTGTELENLHEALQDLRTMAQNYKMNFDLDISTEDDSD